MARAGVREQWGDGMSAALAWLAAILNWATAVGCATLAYLVARADGNALLVGVLAVGALHFATREDPA